MKTFNIAYLIQQFPPEVGAGPARVTEMALRWQEAGARVTVITGLPSRALPGRDYGARDAKYRRKIFLEEQWRGLRVLRSWLSTAKRPGLWPTILNNVTFLVTSTLHAIAKLRHADVLIASSPPFLPHLGGAAISSIRRVPLVLEVRDLWPDYLVGLGILRADNPAARILFALERSLL